MHIIHSKIELMHINMWMILLSDLIIVAPQLNFKPTVSSDKMMSFRDTIRKSGSLS